MCELRQSWYACNVLNASAMIWTCMCTCVISVLVFFCFHSLGYSLPHSKVAEACPVTTDWLDYAGECENKTTAQHNNRSARKISGTIIQGNRQCWIVWEFSIVSFRRYCVPHMTWQYRYISRIPYLAAHAAQSPTATPYLTTQNAEAQIRRTSWPETPNQLTQDREWQAIDTQRPRDN